MATWMTHLRVADYFVKRLIDISEEDFIVGNIGPDCSEHDETWTNFNPPKSITHWFDEEGKIDAEKFYNKYLDKKVVDCRKYSFYLGYYIHLLTDRIWSREIGNPTKIRWSEDFKKYGYNEMWDRIKKDWYDLDHLFLKNHSQFYSFKIFFEMKNYKNDYLPYYPDTAISNQIKYISEFYSGKHEDLERDYKYLTETKMDQFTLKAQKEIEDILIEKNII